MAFFSFSLLKGPFVYLSTKIEPNKKYYSKDIALSKELNNKNKINSFAEVSYENRLSANSVGKKLLICLPPKFGVGDAIEYGIAICSLIQIKKFDKIGVAFTGNHYYLFNEFFAFVDIYPLIISQDDLNTYDTVFHITLEINALKYQKYKRSNIAEEICDYFKVPLIDYKKEINKVQKDNIKTISIFPISTSLIRSLPLYILEEIIESFCNEYEIKIILDNSEYSNYLLENIKNNNFKAVKPINIQSLIVEISKTNFGIFIDSGPLHIAQCLNTKGILIETSVSSKILLSNSNNIMSVKNKYTSNYCNGPCGLVDVFLYENKVGCYETHKINFKDITSSKNQKNLQRWNKKENNSHLILNPVGCIKQIDVKNIIKLIRFKIKER
jgi:ADP-heptose:LPS heptosyltransferase